MNSSVCVVGTDATMVYDALHNVIAEALGELDPSFALQDFTAKDVTSSGGEPVTPLVMEALNTPPFLVQRRVVVVRDAQSLLADEVASVLAWMSDPAPDVVLVLAVVGTKASKLVKGASSVVEVNVGSRTADRVTFVEAKLAEYRVTIDHDAANKITERLGDDVARVDALARTLQTIYGTAPLNFSHVEPYLGDAGDVPEWDLTDAIDGGDAAKAITVARRMLDSKGRAGTPDREHPAALLPAHGQARGERGPFRRRGRGAARYQGISRDEGLADVPAAGHRTDRHGRALDRRRRRGLKGWRQLRREGPQHRHGRDGTDRRGDTGGPFGQDDPGRPAPLGENAKRYALSFRVAMRFIRPLFLFAA